jgi:hypothetical protein
MKMVVKYTTIFVLLFCIENNNLFSQEEENWVEIGSTYDKLDGEWEGKAISHIKSNINNKEFESHLNISMIFNYKKGNKNVSSLVKIDFTDFLVDLENFDKMKERGYTKEKIWILFKVQFGNDFTTSDNYSLIVENSGLADEYFASDAEGMFFMNENQDALLLLYYKPSFILGIGDLGFTRMIFKKTIKYI